MLKKYNNTGKQNTVAHTHRFLRSMCLNLMWFLNNICYLSTFFFDWGVAYFPVVKCQHSLDDSWVGKQCLLFIYHTVFGWQSPFYEHLMDKYFKAMVLLPRFSSLSLGWWVKPEQAGPKLPWSLQELPQAQPGWGGLCREAGTPWSSCGLRDTTPAGTLRKGTAHPPLVPDTSPVCLIWQGAGGRRILSMRVRSSRAVPGL